MRIFDHSAQKFWKCLKYPKKGKNKKRRRKNTEDSAESIDLKTIVIRNTHAYSTSETIYTDQRTKSILETVVKYICGSSKHITTTAKANSYPFLPKTN